MLYYTDVVQSRSQFVAVEVSAAIYITLPEHRLLHDVWHAYTLRSSSIFTAIFQGSPIRTTEKLL